MARPVEFEQEEVLANAMGQFWREGYEASSVQKLLDVTGINRGTLYNSFGDKDTFFKLCLEKYNEMIKSNIKATLSNSEMKPWKAIESYFNVSMFSVTNKQRVLGCLLVNSICESINWDQSVQKILKSSINVIYKALLARTKELKKAGLLKKGVTAELAAEALLNCLHGLRVNSRNAKAPQQMTEILGFTLASLKK